MGTGSPLTSTSTFLLLLRLPAQRSPQAPGKLAWLPELLLFPEQKELDEVAAATATLDEELLAVRVVRQRQSTRERLWRLL